MLRLRWQFSALLWALACGLSAQVPAQGQTVPSRDAVFVMNSDGTGWRKFFELPQIAKLGSPSVSPDGKYLAFDGWMSQLSESSGDSRLFALSTARDEFWLLGSGAMPTWGPDNRRLACSFYSGGVGFLSINDLKTQTIDPQGWGAQWSPNGKWVAYAKGPQLWLYDVDTEKTRLAYDAAGVYQSLYWNSCWSPDSRRIVFCGGRGANERDIASVDVTGGDVKLKQHVTGKNPAQKYSWHPTDPRLVFPMHSPERGRSQLWEFNPLTDDPPKLVPGQDAETAVEGGVWSPDGKLLYCTGKLK